jgi:hypothetical protein
LNGTTAATNSQLETPAEEFTTKYAQPPPASNEIQHPDSGGTGKQAGHNSKAPLLSCLYKVVCDLASKLRRSSRLYQEQLNSTTVSSLDQAADKQMTRLILEQLMDHIEAADRETLIFGKELKGPSGRDDQPGQDEHQKSPINQIQKAVLRNECSQLFTCLDPRQFKRTFSELRWPKRK